VKQLKLNLGCGTDKKPGYINVDIQKDLNPDMVLDVRYLEGINDNSVDEINADHVLEHFPHWQTLSVLEIWTSKLKTGGILQLNVPDMITICELIVSGEDAGKWMRSIYGNQDHSWNYHCAGFTPDIFEKYAKLLNLKVEEIKSHWIGQYPNLKFVGRKIAKKTM